MGANHRTRRCLRIRKANFRAAAEGLGATTDYAIASKLGIHPSTISLLMNRRIQPSGPVIAAALDALGQPFEALFEVVDEVVDQAVDEAA